MDMFPKLTGRGLIFGALFLVGFLLATGRAEAVPAFARKYGMVCTGCHEAWPMLNNVGREFRDNGYRFGLGRDNLITTHTSYFPMSLIAKPHYEYTKRTNQNTDQGVTDLKSGDVTWGAASRDELVNAGADVVIHEVEQLPAAVRRMAARGP